MSFSLDLGQRSRNQNMSARHALQEIEILFIFIKVLRYLKYFPY